MKLIQIYVYYKAIKWVGYSKFATLDHFTNWFNKGLFLWYTVIKYEGISRCTYKIILIPPPLSISSTSVSCVAYSKCCFKRHSAAESVNSTAKCFVTNSAS